MNFMGKMFIVLIFVMSLVFMGLSVAIYATHTNWKKHAEEIAEKVVKPLEKQKADLLTERKEILAKLEAEQSKRRELVANLNTKVEELSQENSDYKEKMMKVEREEEQRNAELKSVHETMAALRGENERYREDFRKSQEEWAKLNTDLVAKTDEVHELALQLTTYRSVGERLAQDYRDAIEVLRKFGKVPKPELYSDIPPKGIKGIVTEVRPNGWVEISIGEDSGLITGHRLDVVRNLEGRSSYIGKIEVVRVEPDCAVARVLPEFRRGTVQRDDDVEYIDISEVTVK